MPRIDFGPRAVPSWSWMAYDGSIEFIIVLDYEMRIPRDADLGFTPDGKGLNVRVRQFENCQLGENEGGKSMLEPKRLGHYGLTWRATSSLSAVSSLGRAIRALGVRGLARRRSMF